MGRSNLLNLKVYRQLLWHLKNAIYISMTFCHGLLFSKEGTLLDKVPILSIFELRKFKMTKIWNFGKISFSWFSVRPFAFRISYSFTLLRRFLNHLMTEISKVLGKEIQQKIQNQKNGRKRFFQQKKVQKNIIKISTHIFSRRRHV